MELLFADYLAHRDTIPCWPPDVFATTALLLKRSGSYIELVNLWPPKSFTISTWTAHIESVGKDWRNSVVTASSPPPSIGHWWTLVLDAAASGVPISAIARSRDLFEAIVSLTAAADEACAGIGIIDPSRPKDKLYLRAREYLDANPASESGIGSTLCHLVDPTVVSVLPKMHTPLSGITFRSLTHNLAYWENFEVRPIWGELDLRSVVDDCFNLLLLPWPLKVSSTPLRPVTKKMPDMSDEFGFFECDVSSGCGGYASRIQKVVRKAEQKTGRIDAVVLPEACMDEDQFFRILDAIPEKLVIGGVAGRCKVAPGCVDGTNIAMVGLRGSKLDRMISSQHKHHRWRLDQRQVRQYGLDSQFRDDKKWWWESIQINQRECKFYNVNTWLTFSVLICEDLARQDPVADLVRSVGPNLVVGLLLDGPQLTKRWPANYATVLADDPRCSVLTLTCVGLVDKYRKSRKSVKRSVALWKDAITGKTRELCLEPGEQGIVLKLKREFEKEWTADGRDDNCGTGYLKYHRAVPIKVAK
jgi:hypothetical protein